MSKQMLAPEDQMMQWITSKWKYNRPHLSLFYPRPPRRTGCPLQGLWVRRPFPYMHLPLF